MPTALDDTDVMLAEKPGVVFGAYGADDWITASYVQKDILAGRNSLAMEGIWITPTGWKFHEWVMANTERYNFMSQNRAMMFTNFGYIEATTSRGKLELELNGEPASVLAFMEQLDKNLKRAENLIEWVYGSRGQSIQLPLNYRPVHDEFYPWLKKSIGDYVDDYLSSSASVLILLGPPGTGKTSFIKNLIHRSKSGAKITYDEKIMSDDSLFANFIGDETRFMIMEDADAFLKAREDGNTMMHRFLNVSDGLISAEGKKLVFSTNLPSVRDVDSALIRPGRCFDVLEFRPLTRAEAQVVADKLDRELPDGDSITLAQLFNTQPSGESVTRTVGFF